MDSLNNSSPIHYLTITVLSTVVTFLFSLFSYLIKVHFDGRKLKSTRYETNIEVIRDADIKAIEVVSYEIRDFVCKYWSVDLDETELQVIGASIIGRIGYLGALFERLFENDEQKLATINLLYKRYCSVCMGKDFLTKSRKQDQRLPQVVERLTYEIIDMGIRLRRELKFEKSN